MYDDVMASESVDDRMALMQQYVDLDCARKQLDKERKFLEEKSQKLASEFRQVTEQLRHILGFEDPMAGAKRSLDAEVAKLR